MYDEIVMFDENWLSKGVGNLRGLRDGGRLNGRCWMDWMNKKMCGGGKELVNHLWVVRHY